MENQTPLNCLVTQKNRFEKLSMTLEVGNSWDQQLNCDQSPSSESAILKLLSKGNTMRSQRRIMSFYEE